MGDGFKELYICNETRNVGYVPQTKKNGGFPLLTLTPYMVKSGQQWITTVIHC